MKSATILLAAFGLILAVTAAKVDYSGHMVIRVMPSTKEHLEFLRDWQHSSTMDFWTLPTRMNQPADIRVSPESYYHVARTLTEQGLDHTIFIKDLGDLERQEQEAIALRRAVFKNDRAIDLENYHTYEEVMAYLDELVATRPTLVSKKVASQTTVEGREIVQVTISSGGSSKQVMFFDCTMHAREWISVATCTWIIDQLVNGYGTDPEITALIDTYDWKFVPITNPDGYAYTWTADRLWRKNRVVNEGSPCLGVDGNRNFPIGFGDTAGSSGLPCSDTYHGTAAFSERETSALKEFIEADSGRVVSAISVHSYSQLWLSPYSYQSRPDPPDLPEMDRAMAAGVNALTATYGTQYTYGPSAATLYVASGVTADYYYVTEGVVHSYVLELRDTGFYGFELPPRFIVPTAEETWNGIKAMVGTFP